MRRADERVEVQLSGGPLDGLRVRLERDDAAARAIACPPLGSYDASEQDIWNWHPTPQGE